MAGTVVIPVEAVRHVELFVIVLILLSAAIGALTEKITIGEIMVHLLYRTRAAHHHAVVALMVFQVVMIYGRGAAEGDITTINQYLRQCVVLVSHIAAMVYSTVRTAISHVDAAS